jgi:hypothetical protein
MNIYAQSSTNVSGGVAATSGLQITTNTPMAFSTNGTERMRITAAGDVGIGTNSPSRKLTVQGDGGVGILPTAGDGITTLSAASTGITVVDCYHGAVAGQFTVRTTAGSGAGTSEKFRIDGSGNVLIGLTSSLSSAVKLQMSDGTITSLFGYKLSGVEYLGTNSNHPLAFLTANAERMRIDASGSLLIGKTAASFATAGTYIDSVGNISLSTAGAAANANIAFYRNASATAVGSITTTSTATTYNTSSDVRLKKNIVEASSAVEKVKALQVRAYDWISDDSHVEHGFVAQELQTVEPLAVVEGETWAIDPSKLVATLTKALQEALSEIDSLKARVAALEI